MLKSVDMGYKTIHYILWTFWTRNSIQELVQRF